jgi:PhzF family phenazine biosynthesis protein
MESLAMPIPIYQIDAFTDRVFSGNPAAVCPLDAWLPDATMQAIAAENNLAETAFLVADEGGQADYRLRWFTPMVEVDLCGHATLASGHLILNRLKTGSGAVSFITRSGVLRVARDGGRLSMDFPSWPPVEVPAPAGLAEALGAAPAAVLKAPQEPERDRLVAVFAGEAEVRGLAPDMSALKRMPGVSVCVTAPGDEADFVSRYFAPNHGIDEDPVTGSNHCLLIPYWATRLGKTDLVARQISRRGGTLFCRLDGDRVAIAGTAADYLKGEIEIA